jgi:hypothetical protein
MKNLVFYVPHSKYTPGDLNSSTERTLLIKVRERQGQRKFRPFRANILKLSWNFTFKTKTFAFDL